MRKSSPSMARKTRNAACSNVRPKSRSGVRKPRPGRRAPRCGLAVATPPRAVRRPGRPPETKTRSAGAAVPLGSRYAAPRRPPSGELPRNQDPKWQSLKSRSPRSSPFRPGPAWLPASRILASCQGKENKQTPACARCPAPRGAAPPLLCAPCARSWRTTPRGRRRPPRPLPVVRRIARRRRTARVRAPRLSSWLGALNAPNVRPALCAPDGPRTVPGGLGPALSAPRGAASPAPSRAALRLELRSVAPRSRA